jgi:hypothetical protein
LGEFLLTQFEFGTEIAKGGTKAFRIAHT